MRWGLKQRNKKESRNDMPKNDQNIIGKDELIHQVAAKTGLSLKETSQIIDAFAEVVQENLSQGQGVRLMGFGTWNIRHVAARRVKYIHTNDHMILPARKRVGFSVGAVLSQAAQAGKC
jgi:DNA-binding protein HU-beta